MHTLEHPWQQLLGAAGAHYHSDADAIIHFGQPEHEWQQAHNAAALIPLRQLASIEVSGADARSFLHNQFTNDVNHLLPGQAQLSAWCTAKGRMFASFIHFPVAPDRYRLILARDLVAAVVKRLQMFVLRAQVQLADQSASHAVLGLTGPGARTALTAAGLTVPATAPATAATLVASAAGTTNAMPEEVFVVALQDGRFLLSLPETGAAALWTRLAAHATAAGQPVWQWFDVQAPLPWVTAATREEFVPQMADFDRLGGVNFHKGCYPGQEIVARTQYLGKVKRHLYRLQSSVTLVAGEELYSPASPDQSAGRVVSCAPLLDGGFVALAVLLASAAGDLHQGSASGPLLQATLVHPPEHS